jgi:hypothetical protein
MAMARQTSSVEYGKDMVTRLARRFMVDCLVVWLLVQGKGKRRRSDEMTQFTSCQLDVWWREKIEVSIFFLYIPFLIIRTNTVHRYARTSHEEDVDLHYTRRRWLKRCSTGAVTIKVNQYGFDKIAVAQKKFVSYW